MAGLFSLKYRRRYSICITLLLTINGLLLITNLTVNQLHEQTSPSHPRISFASFSFNQTTEQNIVQYFQQKERIMKRSPFKTVLRKTVPTASSKATFLIYEYTRHRQFCNRQPSALFRPSTCPFQNCRFTCNSTLVHRADAILMLYSLLKPDKLLELNTNRNPNQIWLLWHDEPYPPSSAYNQFLFNWTISYRLDSEVSVAAYGITFARKQSMYQSTFDRWINENYKKRRNEAVWLVSNCKSKERLQYYEQLKEHFPISASGKCIVNHENDSQQCPRHSQCELDKFSLSKFYLAFESITSRRNYITEKFWRALSHGTIPIVLGPKRQDYERVAPPNSFIYAKDYDDHQKLAKHLDEVARNQHEYEKYHRWRMNYETRYLPQDLESVRFCELCYKLNTNRDRIWYTDINKFFLETDG